MTNEMNYSYSVLRYVHDTATGEFVNVGVVLYCPEARYVSASCRSTYNRLSGMFPDLNGEHFKSLMRYIEARFEEFGARIASELPLEAYKTIESIAHRVLPPDDSSLQWAPPSYGRTRDPSKTLDSLFERFVTRYESTNPRPQKTRDDVWRHFRRSLETRQVLQYFAPVVVSVEDDSIEFKYAWKNGILHCVEPVTFDLATSEGIRDKAHTWLGRISSVQKSSDKFKVYFLAGEPQDEALSDAFRDALRILEKIPGEKAVYTENQAEELGDTIAREVAEHLKG